MQMSKLGSSRSIQDFYLHLKRMEDQIQIIIMTTERVVCASIKMPSGGPVCFISSPAQWYASDVFSLLETVTKVI